MNINFAMPEILEKTIKWFKVFSNSGSSLRGRFASGIFWSIIGAVISRGLNLISSVVVARLLGTIGFGKLGIIQSTVGLFGVFAGFGVGVTLTKYVAEFRDKDITKTERIISLAFKTTWILGGVIGIVLIIFSPWLSEKILSEGQLSGVLRLSTIFLFFGTLTGAQTGALSGFEAFKKIAIVNVISGIASLPLMVLGVRFLKLEGAVLALGCSMLINYLLNRGKLREEFTRFGMRPKYAMDFQEFSIIWKFTLPAFLISLLDVPIIWLCNAMLVNQVNGYAEMGIFNAANQWKNCIVFLPGTLWHFGIATLSNTMNDFDHKKYTKVKNYYLGVSFFLSLVPAILIILLTKVIVRFYGSGFENMPLVLMTLVISGIIWSLNNCLYAEIGSRGMMWHMFILRILWAFEQILMTLFFIKEGGYGLAKAYLFSYMMDFLQRFVILRYFMRR